MSRAALVQRILEERDRQYNLPGCEFDIRNTPNDWAAIAASYVLRSAALKHTKPELAEFEDDLIKAAAVILAALEHLEPMQERGQFQDK
jgi:hypothetical protein